MTQSIYIIRHAEPLITDGQRYGLTTEGVFSVQKLAGKLAKEIPDQHSVAILYSQVERCKHTAEILGKQLNVNPMRANLRFLNIENMQKNDTESKYSQYIDSYKRLEIESPEAYIARFKQMIGREKAEIIIVIANEVNMRVLLQHFMKKPYNIHIDYTHCFKITKTDNPTTTYIGEIK